MTLIAVLVASAVAVLAFDVLASLASLRFGIEYGKFSIGSFAIWGLAGAAAVAAGGPGWWAVLAGTVTAMVESTAGWVISRRLGAGQPTAPVGPATATGGTPPGTQAPVQTPGPGTHASVAAAVTATGAVIGGLGGLLAGLL